jgi:hypothetical protein
LKLKKRQTAEIATITLRVRIFAAGKGSPSILVIRVSSHPHGPPSAVRLALRPSLREELDRVSHSRSGGPTDPRDRLDTSRNPLVTLTAG